MNRKNLVELLNENKLPIFIREDLVQDEMYGEDSFVPRYMTSGRADNWKYVYSTNNNKCQFLVDGKSYTYTEEMVDWDKTIEYSQNNIFNKEEDESVTNSQYLQETLDKIFIVTTKQIGDMWSHNGFDIMATPNGNIRFYYGEEDFMEFDVGVPLTSDYIQKVASKIIDKFNKLLNRMVNMARPQKMIRSSLYLDVGDVIINNKRRYIFEGYDSNDYENMLLLTVNKSDKVILDNPHTSPSHKTIIGSPELIDLVLSSGDTTVHRSHPEWKSPNITGMIDSIEEIRYLGNCEEMSKNIK